MSQLLEVYASNTGMREEVLAAARGTLKVGHLSNTTMLNLGGQVGVCVQLLEVYASNVGMRSEVLAAARDTLKVGVFLTLVGLCLCLCVRRQGARGECCARRPRGWGK